MEVGWDEAEPSLVGVSVVDMVLDKFLRFPSFPNFIIVSVTTSHG